MSGPNVPGSTSTIPDTWSTDTTPASCVVSSTTPPNIGTALPQTPLRPPLVVSAMLCCRQILTMATTSSVFFGRQTACGLRGVLPARAQCMASGHQSRPCSARSASSTDVEQTFFSCSITASSTDDPPANCSPTASGEMLNAMGGIGSVMISQFVWEAKYSASLTSPAAASLAHEST